MYYHNFLKKDKKHYFSTHVYTLFLDLFQWGLIQSLEFMRFSYMMNLTVYLDFRNYISVKKVDYFVV